jgi:uncharacterized protein YggE
VTFRGAGGVFGAATKEDPMKLAHVAVIGAAGLLAVLLAGVFQPTRAHSAGEPASGRITVVGTGTSAVVPDRASFSFGTVRQDGGAAGALRSSAETVARIVDAVRSAGVAKADIQTAEVSLAPRTNADGDAVVGYTASDTVTVTIRELGSAGTVVDAAVRAGANQVYGPDLVAADRDASYREALAAAVDQARAKAESLARTAGATLGRITAVAEQGDAQPQPAFAAADTARSSIDVEPGRQTVEATVTVTFALT